MEKRDYYVFDIRTNSMDISETPTDIFCENDDGVKRASCSSAVRDYIHMAHLFSLDIQDLDRRANYIQRCTAELIDNIWSYCPGGEHHKE